MDSRSASERQGLVVPCTLAFLSSFCVMAVEMAASRMMSRSVGAGLYTWTSVIGVVLGGITIGNAVGGRLADRFPTRASLPALLLASAFVSLAAPLLYAAADWWSGWDAPSDLSLPLRIAMHVTGAFLLPAACLGMLGPVIAKDALEHRLAAGRTVGTIYAWGALGSIAGTWASGFWIVSALGTGGLCAGVAGLLAIASLLLSPRVAGRILLAAWPAFACLLVASFVASGRQGGRWSYADGELRLWDRRGQRVVWATESSYSSIRVMEARDRKSRTLSLDHLIHAMYVPGDPSHLMYDYEKVYASITDRAVAAEKPRAALFFGGGGYVFPRYLRSRFPDCRIQVAEIDPTVTVANFEAFGLLPDEVEIAGSAGAGTSSGNGSPSGAPPRIEIFHLDARNHVEDLVRGRTPGGPFDLIYGDAFNDYCVPFHLVTREFAEKVRDLLRPGTGVYLINVIDIFESGRFLGAIRNTLAAVFPKVHVFTANRDPPTDESPRATFVILAAMGDVDLADLGGRPGETPFTGYLLGEAHLRALSGRSEGRILTDDYSPVENLLDVVVRRRGRTGS